MVSALGDIEGTVVLAVKSAYHLLCWAGFVHTDLTKAPSVEFQTPKWSTTADLDYAGNDPTNFVRIGTTSDAYV